MKKRILLAAAVFAMSFCATGAARSWTITDLQTLQTGILTTGAPAVYDLDNSGEVDVFDLGLMKRALLKGKH